MKGKWFVWSGLWLLVLSSCRPTEREHVVNAAFYHWKSELNISHTEQVTLDSLKVRQLYLRYFDLDWNGSLEELVPLAPLQIGSPLSPMIKVIPTVFITNRSLQHPQVVDLVQLSEKIAQKIQQINGQMAISEVEQIQFDCDWTQSTRKDYFRLLELLKKAFPGVKISATIRLHQIKYPEQTGVPPVDRGMLMFYNMGSVEDPAAANSIFDWDIAKAYLQRLPDYPLPLDLALPIFSWGVVFRDGKMVQLLNNLRQEDLSDTTRFHLVEPHWMELVKSTYIQGYYLYQGDRVRLESVEAGALHSAVATLRHQIANDSMSLAFYHLDTSTLKQYTYADLQSLLQTLAQP